MKLKEILIGVVAVVLVALVAVGATLAYLTATDEVTNVMTVGDVELEILEFERVSTDTSGVAAQLQVFRDDKKLIPAIVPAEFDYTKKDATINWDEDKDGKEIKKDYTSAIWDPAKIRSEEDKMVFVKNTGKHTDAYVRLYFAFEAGNYASFEQFQNKIHLNINEQDWTWEWEERLAEIKGMKCFVACATYQKAIAPDELTTISLSQIALDAYATNADSASFGEKYDVLVVGQGIQSGGMGTADEALDKGFGDEIPFAGFRFVDFADLKTALHYLDADTSSTYLGGGDKASYDVSTVTFGLFEDYYEEVVGHDGVATTNASGDGEFAGYTYYVPNGDKYDVYVLADTGKIYAPVDSQKLFWNMRALTKVDTSNFDVSQTTKASDMFFECESLQTIDVKDWDVSKLKDAYRMFSKCTRLAALDVSNWNVSSLETTKLMFSECQNLAYLDVANWNVSNVNDMYATFYNCQKLDGLNVSGWNVSKVTSMESMFRQCYTLSRLDASKWDVSNVKNMVRMFDKCYAIEEIDVTGWDVSSVTSMARMFQSCQNLRGLAVDNWDVGKVESMNYIFDGCSSLTSDKFNVSQWNVSNVINFGGMFSSCSSLTTLDLSGWKTDKAETMYEVFYKCSKLTALNVSTWNVSKVTNMSNMFGSCSVLAMIDLSDWNTTSLTSTRNMFSFCFNLETIYVGEGWNVKNVSTHDGMFSKDDKLVGGAGTPYRVNADTTNPADKTYARIDNPPDAPGYLTSKNNS